MILLQHLEDYMLPCFNKQILGIECLGCGLQRSILLLLKGDFIAAFFMYPAIYPIIGIAAVILFNIFYKLKQYNKIISILAIVTVASIVINFTIKTIIN